MTSTKGPVVQHLAINVRDIEASHRFYTDVLGFEHCGTLAIPGILAGSILAFAKALGEFGATITFVSNIPGETQTLKWVPEKSGMYPMYCTDFCSALHQEMQGYVRVSPKGSSVPITFSLGKNSADPAEIDKK